MEAKETDVHAFLDDLDGGVFAGKLGRVISDVAAGVCDNDGKGKVVVELTISPVGNGGSIVNVQHRLKYERPTMRGKQTEEETTATPMHVGKGGSLSFMPENQRRLFENQEGA